MRPFSIETVKSCSCVKRQLARLADFFFHVYSHVTSPRMTRNIETRLQRLFYSCVVQVLRALLRADPQEKLLAITRELAALKLANGQLQDSLARACQKQDAAVTHASALHRVIDQLESNLERAAPPETDESIEGDPPVTSAAELSARLAVKTQELFALQDEGLAQRQRIARLEADLTEAQAQRAESVGAVGRQREQLEAGAQARAEEAAAAHREELRKVRQELEAGARAHRQERAALHQEKVSARNRIR